MSNPDQLNAKFVGPGLLPDSELRFEPGQGSLTRAIIDNSVCKAEVYLQGAHVTKWRPAGQTEVLWLSEQSWFEAGKPIRGGVPICFPWFGAHQSDASLPSHGTARLIEWHVTAADVLPDGAVQIVLAAEIDAFAVRYTIAFGASLAMSLQVMLPDTAQQPQSFEAALHTYFSVSDVRQVTIEGLESAAYIDKMDAARVKPAAGQPIRFEQETDRVYFDTDAVCVLRDPGHHRRITVSKSGSLSTIVWNPWTAKAARMPDFGDGEWPEMVCIESANVASNAVKLQPGQNHQMNVTIALETMT